MSKRKSKFIVQKLIGVVVILLTFLLVKMLNGDATVAVITVPIGLMAIFSKDDILW